jgi:type IX secretion system PorP/SprF family membrane protein
MKYFFVFIILNFRLSIYAQAPHFSQYFTSPLTINPAFTGNSNSDFRIFSNFRQQWLGINSAYQTSKLDLDARLLQSITGEANKFGLGASFISDKSLSGLFRSTYATISTSYMIGLNEYNFLGIGFGASFSRKSLDYSQATFSEQFDGERFNESFPNNEIGLFEKKQDLSISTGLLYRFEGEESDVEIGVSGYNLNKHNQSFFADNLEYIPSRYVFHSGFNTYVNEKLNLGISLIFQNQGAVNYIAGGGVLSYSLGVMNKRLAAGMYYRHQDAIYPYVGFTTEKLQIGLSYDITISKIKTSAFSPKTFELSLVFFKKHIDEKMRKLIPWGL